MHEYSFPVPDFFETFEQLTIPTILKRLNEYDQKFLQVDIITGAEQISVKHLLGPEKQVIGRQVIFTLPGRLETDDKSELMGLAIGAGWHSLAITENSFGFNTYTKFYLTRKFV